MIYFVLGWILIGTGCIGLIIGQMLIESGKRRIRKEQMQEEGEYEVSELPFSGRK